MRYFYRIAQGLMVTQMMQAVMRQPELWNEDDCRTTFEGTPHADVSDILLRFGKTDGNDLDASDRRTMKLIANAKPMCLDVMRLVNGCRLGRVVITKLESGARILPHSDTKGDYASYYSRYHLVLHGLPGSMFRCGDETVNMQTGELWWFNTSEEHELMNNSPDDRVHMLIDCRVDP